MQAKNISVVSTETCHLLTDSAVPFMLVLRRGEDVVDSIIKCAEAIKLTSATFSGIGALENPTLGFYNLQAKEYQYKKFDGFYELVSLTGNITKHNGQYITHIHVVLSNAEYETIAGHLKSTKVGVTAEINMIPFKYVVNRKLNQDFNAYLIDA